MGFDKANENFNNLKDNEYPGRGIVIGKTPDDKNLVQVYWIMGRSENSRNRIFVKEGDFVKTKAYDEKKLSDPSLIIYYPVKNIKSYHIVTNGDQTDTVYDKISNNQTFEDAMAERKFEPDAPNFTPRISGLINLNDENTAYKLAVLKTIDNNGDYGQKNIFHYQKAIKGYGHLITTYEANGNPLPSFKGEPKIMPLRNDIEKTADYYWQALNSDNKVALLVKFINKDTGEFKITIRNKLS